jgi:hypothetical protein
MPFSEKKHNKIFTISFFIILLTGWGLRCYQYLIGRSLWEDEAHLALNFMSRNYAQLLQPLDYVQAAPPLFLLTVKLCTTIFSYGPKALHLLPFLTSMLSLPLYYFLAKRLTGSRLSALIAFLLFSVNIALIYFSSELKTYGIDVAMYLTLVWLAVSPSATLAKHRNLLIAVAGSVFIFYSNITFVILFCIGCEMIADWIRNKKLNKAQLAILLCWLALYAAYYIKFVYHHPHAAAFKKDYGYGFPPADLFSSSFLSYLHARYQEIAFYQMLHLPDMLLTSVLLLLTLVAGIISSIRQKRYKLLLYTVTPVIIHFLLAVFRIYPFWYRFILYLMPGIILLMAYGTYMIAEFLARKVIRGTGAALITACSIFFIYPSVTGFPLWFKEIRPSLQYIDSFPATTKLYITTPYTLYKYSYMNKNVKNDNYEALQWPVGPEQYFETVGATKGEYLLLHATDTATDGYGPVLRALKDKGLIKKEFNYKTFTVSLVKSLSNSEAVLNYESFPKDKTFDLNGKKVTALWDNTMISAKELSLGKGIYEVTAVSSGTPAKAIYPHINILINEEKIHSYFTPADYGKEIFSFEQKNEGALTVKLQMDNDLNDTLKHEDRNAFMLYLQFKKIDSF